MPVRDLSRALAFYVGVLGMQVSFQNGDPVGFVILERDAADLHLTLVPAHRPGTHNVARLLGTEATQAACDATCWSKIDGRWLVDHEHVSVPAGLATGEALLDLTP